MSTAKVITVVHPSATVNNLVNDASGNVTVGNDLYVPTGNVGIGKTPGVSTMLDVLGNATFGSTIANGNGVSTGTASIELGGNRTGDGTSFIDIHSTSGSDYEARIIRSDGANGVFNIINQGTGVFALTAAGAASMTFATSNTTRMTIDTSGNVIAGGSVALATTATNGFLYVPTCAGTPTGTPTTVTGMAPVVVNTTNNKLYFYSGGAWRDAGP
jgi:hypothetical protein